MSIFYNPQTKKPQVWVLVSLIIVPLILFALTMVLGQQMKQNKKSQGVVENDIFSK